MKLCSPLADVEKPSKRDHITVRSKGMSSYPKQVITIAETELNLYVDTEKFTVTLTLHNTKPVDSYSNLLDTIEVSV